MVEARLLSFAAKPLPIAPSLSMHAGLVAGDALAPIIGSLVFKTAGARAANATQPAICLLGLLLVLAAYLSYAPSLLRQTCSRACGMAARLAGQLQQQLPLSSQGSTSLLLTHLSGAVSAASTKSDSDEANGVACAETYSTISRSSTDSTGSTTWECDISAVTTPVQDACCVIADDACKADATCDGDVIGPPISTQLSVPCNREDKAAGQLQLTAVSKNFPAPQTMARSTSATCMLLWLSSTTSKQWDSF